jgi:hypothetical protein
VAISVVYEIVGAKFVIAGFSALILCGVLTCIDVVVHMGCKPMVCDLSICR